jgi:hypothetical protein
MLNPILNRRPVTARHVRNNPDWARRHAALTMATRQRVPQDDHGGPALPAPAMPERTEAASQPTPQPVPLPTPQPEPQRGPSNRRASKT